MANGKSAQGVDGTPADGTKVVDVNLVGPPPAVTPLPRREMTVGPPDSGPLQRHHAVMQESARQRLMTYLVGILALEVFFCLIATWLPGVLGGANMTMADLKELMIIVFGPTLALVGSAAGFYFGTRSNTTT